MRNLTELDLHFQNEAENLLFGGLESRSAFSKTKLLVPSLKAFKLDRIDVFKATYTLYRPTFLAAAFPNLEKVHWTVLQYLEEDDFLQALRKSESLKCVIIDQGIEYQPRGDGSRGWTQADIKSRFPLADLAGSSQL